MAARKTVTRRTRPQSAINNVFTMLDQAQIQEFKVFNMIDQNHDNFIDEHKSNAMFTSLGREASNKFIEDMNEASGSVTFFGDKLSGTNLEEISFSRQRLHNHELQSLSEPSLRFAHRFHFPKTTEKILQFKLKERENTSRIGLCKEITLIKDHDGFGFSYAGRLNSLKEHLYYVKGLRKELDLSIGDRILKINGVELSDIGQSQVTTMLKEIPIGDSVLFLISQVEQKQSDGERLIPMQYRTEERILKEKTLQAELASNLPETHAILPFDIPLNETPGAGLGISVKAQRLEGTDMGLYVRRILHGSAAYKDGRLRINDRLAGIETVNLLNFEFNSDALTAFMRTLTHLPSSKQTVRLYIARLKCECANDGLMPLHQQSICLHIRCGNDSELSQAGERQFVRDSASRRSISAKRPLRKGHIIEKDQWFGREKSKSMFICREFS